MIRPRYQSRLSALILGVRPSMTHVNGVRITRTPDNFSRNGTIAWQTGLQMLLADLNGSHELSTGEKWLQDWVAKEAARDAVRWSDASSMLELLSISLGPTAPEPELLRDPTFWAQWSRNIDAMRFAVEGGSSLLSSDSPELANSALELVNIHGGPSLLAMKLEQIAEAESGSVFEIPVFRGLCSAVERVQLTTLVESSMTGDPMCTATEASLLDQRVPSVTPAKARSCRRRPAGDRARPRHISDGANQRRI